MVTKKERTIRVWYKRKQTSIEQTRGRWLLAFVLVGCMYNELSCRMWQRFQDEWRYLQRRMQTIPWIVTTHSPTFSWDVWTILKINFTWYSLLFELGTQVS
jgi:hypothetical protein